MAKLYQGTTDGLIWRIIQDDKDAEILGGDLSGALSMLEYDPETNKELHSRLMAHATRDDHFRLIAGILFQDDAPVVINPDGEKESLRKQIATLVQNGRDYVANSSPTNAQTTAAVKNIIRLLIYLIIYKMRLV